MAELLKFYMIDSINAKWNFISKLVKIFGAEEERTC